MPAPYLLDDPRDGVYRAHHVWPAYTTSSARIRGLSPLQRGGLRDPYATVRTRYMISFSWRLDRIVLISVSEYLDVPAPCGYGASEFGHVIRVSRILREIHTLIAHLGDFHTSDSPDSVLILLSPKQMLMLAP